MIEINYKPIKSVTIYHLSKKDFNGFCSLHCVADQDVVIFWAHGMLFVCYYFTQTDNIMSRTLNDLDMPISEISYCECKEYRTAITHPIYNTSCVVRDVTKDPVFGEIGRWLYEHR